MDTGYLEDLKAAVEDTLQSTAHVVQTCHAAYRQAQEKLEKVHEEVTQERKQLEIALNTEKEMIAAVQHCLLAHMQELTAVQGAKHDLCSSSGLPINHLDIRRQAVPVQHCKTLGFGKHSIPHLAAFPLQGRAPSIHCPAWGRWPFRLQGLTTDSFRWLTLLALDPLVIVLLSPSSTVSLMLDKVLPIR
ncbi:hypothetical protein AOLI_G00153110 [Acnodon oligacanthus]